MHRWPKNIAFLGVSVLLLHSHLPAQTHVIYTPFYDLRIFSYSVSLFVSKLFLSCALFVQVRISCAFFSRIELLGIMFKWEEKNQSLIVADKWQCALKVT